MITPNFQNVKGCDIISNMKIKDQKRTTGILALLLVVFLWGMTPLVTLKLYDYYSPAFRLFLSEVSLVAFYLCVAHRNLGELNRSYFRTAVPIGCFYAAANVLQNVGLAYTTPAKYAFLENLSVLVVPFLSYFLTRKKPTVFHILASALCLFSAFALNGLFNGQGFSVGLGEILCGLAGIFYGVNIAGTGACIKKFNATLYLLIQSAISMIFSLATALILNVIPTTDAAGNATVIEPLVATFEPLPLIALVVSTILISGVGWILRTNAQKHVDAVTVGVIMPFAAVVTSVMSVLLGSDTLTSDLLIGGGVGIASIFLSEFGDHFKEKKKNPPPSSDEEAEPNP